MPGWFKSRKFKAANYSLELRNFSRECLEAVYREGNAAVIFGGERVGRKWEQINLRAPSELPESDYPRVLPNVVDSLANLGYESLVFKTGPAEAIPQEEQQAAIAGLRRMGMEPNVSRDGSTVQWKKIPGWQTPPAFDPKTHALEMMQLLMTARNKRSQIEILAKSTAAVVDFL